MERTSDQGCIASLGCELMLTAGKATPRPKNGLRIFGQAKDIAGGANQTDDPHLFFSVAPRVIPGSSPGRGPGPQAHRRLPPVHARGRIPAFAGMTKGEDGYQPNVKLARLGLGLTSVNSALALQP